MRWILDIYGTIVNLDHIESIGVTEVDEEETREELTGCQAQVVASNASDEAYCLFAGTVEQCNGLRAKLGVELSAIRPEVIHGEG